MRTLALALVLSLSACPADRPAESPAPAPGPSEASSEAHEAAELPGTIMYRSALGVSVIDPGGTPRLVLKSPATHADWSPDGSRLVYTVELEQGSQIWVGDADGGHPRLLFDCTDPCSFADDPAWSPDGRSIAFWFNDTRHPAVQPLRIVDPETGRVRRDITFGRGRAPEYPQWSPDGTRIVVQLVTYRKEAGEWTPIGQSLATIAADRRQAQPTILTQMPLGARQPTWSPDGRLIAFDAGNPDPFSGQGAAANIWTVGADGSGLTQVTHQGDDDDWAALPSWTRSGLLATRISGSGYTLVEIDDDGTLVDLVDATGAPVTGLRPRLRPGI